MQGSHGRRLHKKTMCSQIVYTPEWERVERLQLEQIVVCVCFEGLYE